VEQVLFATPRTQLTPLTDVQTPGPTTLHLEVQVVSLETVATTSAQLQLDLNIDVTRSPGSFPASGNLKDSKLEPLAYFFHRLDSKDNLLPPVKTKGGAPNLKDGHSSSPMPLTAAWQWALAEVADSETVSIICQCQELHDQLEDALLQLEQILSESGLRPAFKLRHRGCS
jgi:hypothetical protein